MRKSFLLRCEQSNPQHTQFSLFDPQGANCGTITVLTSAVDGFIRYDWNGNVDWNGKLLKETYEL